MSRVIGLVLWGLASGRAVFAASPSPYGLRLRNDRRNPQPETRVWPMSRPIQTIPSAWAWSKSHHSGAFSITLSPRASPRPASATTAENTLSADW